ncbi:hypothetical protein CEE36_08350 [candidate division TA06 bacterium B3_TA06]|uniref:Uncharacterized protein n=1 Tax=candidate division TA06 bacterium B3_TA06 TaxID=2012487 RepID=A0A532V282_UNCT6|nr:MAG: hypothetical protein CEE36_08350 [candidate division TA06 bacterium B3_TA06]
MGKNPSDEINELLKRARKLNEELRKIKKLLSSRERRFHRAFLVTLDEQQYLYAVCFAAPMSDPVSARSVIQNAMLVSDYFNDIWITEDSQGNLIGYGTKEESRMHVVAPEWVYFEYYNVPRETEAEYQEALDKLRRDGIIKELTDLIIEEVEYLYQLGKIYRDGLREIEDRRIEAIKEQVPQPQASIYTGKWWEVIKKDAEVYAILKKGVKDDEQAKKIMSISLSIASIVTSLAIPVSLTATLISVALAGAGIAVTCSAMNEWADREIKAVEKELEGTLSWYDLEGDESVRSFYGGYESYAEAQKVFRGLVLDPSALEIRNYQIERFLPFIKDLAELSYSELANENRSKGLGDADHRAGGTGDLAFDTMDWWATGGKIKGYISGLMAILFDQPNPLIMAYELAKKYVFPDIFTDEKKHRELKSVLSEYVDQSHWRLVPDDRAIYAWAKVLNLTPGQFKLIAPDEDFIRLKKVTYHPLIAGLKEWINFFTGGDPGNEWLNMYYQKMLSESEELGLGGALPEEPVDAGVLAASGYGVTQGVAAASYTRGADYTRGGGEVSSAPFIPTTGYGAGFLGMPSGGGDTTTSSSLSLPSFPSVSLPSLGGWPSALPSPVGPGGTKSSMVAGMLSLAMYGAFPQEEKAQAELANMTPAGGDGAMASGGYFLGGLKQLVAGQGNGRGGFSPALDLGAFLLAPFKNLLPSQRPSAPGSRVGKLAERLFQVPQMMLTASPLGSLFAAGGTAGNLLGGLSEPQPQPQVVYRFEQGSVQIHTQKISPERLGNVFIDFLRQYSQAQ